MNSYYYIHLSTGADADNSSSPTSCTVRMDDDTLLASKEKSKNDDDDFCRLLKHAVDRQLIQALKCIYFFCTTNKLEINSTVSS